jgi:hypothetical protein
LMQSALLLARRDIVSPHERFFVLVSISFRRSALIIDAPFGLDGLFRQITCFWSA